MKTYRTTSGPFAEKPFYSPNEIETICIDELRKAGLLPSSPEPIRVERFVEKKFKIHIVYDDLPEGVLGFTEFGPNGVKGMTITKTLLEEGDKVAERRINTTLAHEAGHGLLHTHLFVLGENLQSLFGKDVDPDKHRILCRNNAIQGFQGFKGTSNPWWEIQANLVIGPLLMPKALVMTALEPFYLKSGKLDLQRLDRSRQEEAVKALSESFDVNPIVAKIRLESVFPPAQDSQLTL